MSALASPSLLSFRAETAAERKARHRAAAKAMGERIEQQVRAGELIRLESPQHLVVKHLEAFLRREARRPEAELAPVRARLARVRALIAGGTLE